MGTGIRAGHGHEIVAAIVETSGATCVSVRCVDAAGRSCVVLVGPVPGCF